MKIAYIEDDRDSLTIFARRFRADHITCDTFESAEAAESSVQPGTYDALILDIRLPGISGVEFLSKLRQKGIHTPAILITAFNSVEHMREALNAQAAYLLEKPFAYRVIRDILDKIIQNPSSIQHCVDRGLARLQLTTREEDVARWVLKGLSNAEIARVAILSEKTVKQYVTQIFDKSGVTSRAEFFSLIFPV